MRTFSGSEVKTVLTRAALEGGRIVKKYFLARGVEIREKTSPADLVTNVDLLVQEKVTAIFRKGLPGATVMSEESEATQVSEEMIYIDPIDGTLNFVHGFPLCAISIGYWRDGVPLAGVVYNPVMDELFAAQRGRGATRNGKAISVSSTRGISNSLLSTGWPYERGGRGRLLNAMEKGYIVAQEIRTLGSASLALCYVASGALDGYWEWDLSPWDMAAGVLIVEEAGGRVTNVKGGAFQLDRGGLVASNGRIHSEIIRKVTR
jgi:myo-inositol-1(or 4)-monophosphatase